LDIIGGYCRICNRFDAKKEVTSIAIKQILPVIQGNEIFSKHDFKLAEAVN
jgi:hypothetical protein